MSEPAQVSITLQVNGAAHQVSIRSDETLLDVLRHKLRLTGSKEGCGQGECGACTVLIDSKPVMSCLTLAACVSGKNIVTVEGVEHESRDLREAFADRGAFQCGFCTSGQIVRASALLRDDALANLPLESKERFIRKQMSGNICRCTGYNAIVDAILEVTVSRARSAAANRGQSA